MRLSLQKAAHANMVFFVPHLAEIWGTRLSVVTVVAFGTHLEPERLLRRSANGPTTQYSSERVPKRPLLPGAAYCLEHPASRARAVCPGPGLTFLRAWSGG
jgi:hypothetical protein